MPKESTIKKHAIVEFKKRGWLYWFPPRSHWAVKEKDIFGVWDCFVIDKNQFLPIQLTSLNNIRAREKKIKSFTVPNKVSICSQVWGWDSKKKAFKVLYLY